MPARTCLDSASLGTLAVLEEEPGFSQAPACRVVGAARPHIRGPAGGRCRRLLNLFQRTTAVSGPNDMTCVGEMDASEDGTSGTFIHLRRMAVPANTHKTSMPSMVVCSDRTTVPIDDLMTVFGGICRALQTQDSTWSGEIVRKWQSK
jgi:hypothetical protein